MASLLVNWSARTVIRIFAYVGNALPNSQQWRDAKRLRDAGCTIIRVAHYPQDPAFMDACDEMGAVCYCGYSGDGNIGIKIRSSQSWYIGIPVR